MIVRSETYPRSVKYWLLLGVFMIIVQVIVGGITRLTESGLSITKWDVVSGTFPPFTDVAWFEEFELYKNTPQYREVNEGMTIADFKFIYFWEWVHRFWARFMGLVFLIPFVYFLIKRKIDNALAKRLGFVVFLAALAALFGWIMVASGLVERPWVNAYKLSIHLSIALSVFSALLWTYLWSRGDIGYYFTERKQFRRQVFIVLTIFIIQMLLGGVLSGMKAAVVYPTWPEMNGTFLPSQIFDIAQWKLDNFIHYDNGIFLATLIHFLHRNTAYILFFTILYVFIRMFKSTINKEFRIASMIVVTLVCCQVLLGIITVVSSVGSVPVLWGTLHQAFALLLLASLVYTIFLLRIK